MADGISSERKLAYYVGTAILGLGPLSFVGNVLMMASWTGGAPPGGTFVVAVTSMCMMFIGSIVRRIGARGLAGSGVLLDLRRARGDLEPYARMAGGLAKDALDEAGLAPGTRPVVMLECASCARRNESDARFCQGCGKAL